jgi:hypothetical protein
MDYIIVQYVSNKAREMTQMDTPNICNVEGDNNRLSSCLRLMECVENPFFVSFLFVIVFSISEITYLYSMKQTIHVLNTID